MELHHNEKAANYHVEKTACGIRGELFTYKVYTSNNIADKSDSNSAMEVQFFATTFTNNSKTLKDAFLADRIHDYKKRNCTRTDKKLENTVHNDKANQRISLWKNIGVVILVIILSVLLHLLFYQPSTLKNCVCEVNIKHLQKDLLKEVYNQTECIDSLILSLQNRSHWPKKHKVLLYIGSTGVGKTLVVNIAKRHFPKERVVDIIHFDHKKMDSSYFKKCCTLIIIDNLNVGNISNTIEFLTLLPNTTYILVIIVFNPQKADRDLNYIYDHNAVKTIHKQFSPLYFESCTFNTLDKTNALIWLQKEFTKRNLSDTKQKNITDYILANINFTKNGFKRLKQKLHIATEMFNTD